MAISFVAAVTGTFTNGPITVYTFPTIAATSGNLLVVGLRATNGSGIIASIGDTAGNTYQQAGTGTQDSGGTQLELWYCGNCAGNANNVIRVSLTGSIQFVAGMAGQYSGVATTSPLDITATGSVNPAYIVSSAPFTTSVADEVIIGFVQQAATFQTWSPGTGFTDRGSDDSEVTMLMDKIVAAIQTSVAVTANSTGSNPKSIQVATFKAAAAAPIGVIYQPSRLPLLGVG